VTLRVALLICACFCLIGDSDARSGDTRKMAALLDRIYREQDWKTDPSKASERVVYYRELLQRRPPIKIELQARLDLSEHLLVAGDSAIAAVELETLRGLIQKNGAAATPALEHEAAEMLAIAYLRAGEQQNCLTNHNAESCVYPIRGGGVHLDRRGAQAAADEYTKILERDPHDLASRWLLNIAYMTLGRHPEAVPAKWLIPASILPDEYDIKPFSDVAASAGVAASGHAGGSVAEDFDGDGLFDLMISSSGPRDQVRYFHNKGDGTFEDQTLAAGLEGITGGLNLIHADFDNDGRPDVLVLRGGWWGEHGKYPVSLLHNNGPNAKGQITFSDVTEHAGLLSFHPTQTAAWADFDGDGWLDLYIGHESSKQEPHPSALYHNNRDGTFTDIAPQAGVANMGFVKGVAWGDYNNDGRPDLYISRKGAANVLLRNDGPDKTRGWKFTDVTAAAGVAEPVQSFATWFFDYDNDGWLDLLVTGYYIDTLADIPAFHLGLPNKAEVPRLYHNNGDGTFRDVTKAVGLDRVILAMGVGFGDLDNDGWLDCYFGTGAPEYGTLLPNRMFRNAEGKRFQDVTTSGRFGQLQKGHAISFADFDRDGDQDIFEVLGGAFPGDVYYSALLENPGHGNHWIGLRLEGVQSNRSAIGARVRVDIATPSGKRSIFRVVNSGTSFGDSPLELHVGLAQAKAIEGIQIQWPAGEIQQLPGLALDRAYEIREGASPQVVALKRFAFRTDSGPHHH
jgi:FG-GAP-like repeat/ASPIC and UnbV